ncbi:hypothetical protein J2W48_002919 [Flavobacterium piscis]|uniref:Uncharacterized protein n=1 Tax=Flavobacterium piscis TaxID=1114874 RepID=A0ABU1Y9S0_9FLAO|nr:hypothetical protein [Flavobacterium piscis]
MAQSEPKLGELELFYGWYIQVGGNAKELTNDHNK